MTTKNTDITRVDYARTVNKTVTQKGTNVNASRTLATRPATRTLKNSGTRGCKSCGK